MARTRLIKPRKHPDRVISFPLEHQIPVNYCVVGRPAWQRHAIPPGAAAANERLTVRSPHDLDPVFDYFDGQRVLACDTETSGPSQEDGLDPVSPTSKIVLFQLGAEDRVYLFEPDLLGYDPRFRNLLEGTENLFVLQNAVHDFKFLLTKYRIHLARLYCTMLAEQLLTAGKEGVKVGLSELARKYPPYRYIRKAVRAEFIRHTGVFTRQQLYYGARDVLLLPAISRGQIALMKQYDLLRVAKDEFDSIPVTAEMEIGGVHLDAERIRITQQYFEKVAAAAEAQVHKIYNDELRRLGLLETDLLGERPESFNLQSPDAKLKALARLGIHLEDVERETLLTVDHPIAKPLADYVECQKVIGTYCKGLLGRIHPHTGLVHPQFHQHGRGDRGGDGADGKANISSGRYSGDMQQLPRPDRIFDEVTDSAELQQVYAMWPERFTLAA
jgi:hypothetical protein